LARAPRFVILYGGAPARLMGTSGATMIRLTAVLLACGVLAASPALGASPDPKSLAVAPEELSKARELVRRLGSDFYREREEAQAQLAKLGRVARQALAEAVAGDPDPEIRLRASRLLPKASADDLKARIDTFLADTAGKYDHDLPGLKTFRKGVGTDEKARALYVEILKSPYNLDMFAAIDKGETEGGRAIADRRGALWNDMQFRPVAPGSKPFQPKQPTLPEIAALLYAETLVTSDHIPKTTAWTWINGTQFVQQPASVQALNGGSGVAHAEVYKGIVRKWLASRTDPQELTNLSYQLGNSTLKQFPESQTVLRRVVMTDGVQGYAKGQALNWLVQQRGKDEMKFFQAIMKNELRVGDYPDLYPNEKNPDRTVSMANDQMIQQVWFNKPNGQAEMHTCFMKDVALAYLVTQSGGNIKDYHFETPQGVLVNPGQVGFGQYAFTTEAKRAAGFMKWGWKQVKDSIEPPAKKDAPKEAPKGGPQPTPGVKPRPAPAPAPVAPAPAVIVVPAKK
jgi:hypothetical protein